MRILEERLAAASTAPERLDALNDLALALSRAGDAERAMPLAREAKRLAGACGDDIGLAFALASIGMCHYLQARYAEGLDESLRAVAFAERGGNPEATATALVYAAACQYQMGAREEALLALHQALEVVEESSCGHLLTRVHNALGVILGDKGRLHEAESHYRRALDFGTAAGDDVYIPRVKMNYASLHRERGKLLESRGFGEGAHEQFREGVRLCEELRQGGLGGAYDEAHCACTLGELYRDLGETDRAMTLFHEMLQCGTEVGNPHHQAEALLNIGKAHMSLGRVTDAKEHFERALDLASGANVRRLIGEGFLSLAAWAEACGDLRQALEYQKRFNILNEQLVREELHASGMAHGIWLKSQQLRRELRSHQERLDGLSREVNEDSLTGLSNRRFLDARLAELAAGARHDGARTCVGIVDIDHFKSINDLASHSLGDAVLRTVANMIAAHCREGDISARFGGDEFVICLSATRLEAGVAAFERLRLLVASHDWCALHPQLSVTLSIGVAEIQAGDSVTSLMDRVDASLYRAKRLGRNCVVGDPGRESRAGGQTLH